MAESKHEATFRPISPNPYIVGNPVRDPKMFYGRQAEFSYVRKRFLDSERGGLLVFCGERRSGKTSILFQILDGRLGHDFIPVLIDMQSMAIQSEVDFLAKISDEIVRVLADEGITVSPPQFGQGSKPSAIFLSFIQSVLEACPSKKPILLFDEYELFENKIDSGVLTEEVLHMLSHMMETYSVFLIFTGSQHVEQRKQDYWKILGRSLHRTISFLHYDDALRLIREPVDGRIHFDARTDESIYRLSAGQPFYTQAICQSLVDHLNADETSHASPEIVAAVVADIVENPFPQMTFLWESLELDEKLILGLLAERLQTEDDFASSDDLMRLLASRKYPLDLGSARVSTALEKLFKQDLVLKNDSTPPGYAFRVDLWRHWVRRMHSVWQVMREEGIAIPRRGGRSLRVVIPTVLTAVVAIAVFVILDRRRPPDPGPTVQEFSSLEIVTAPGATIYRDGQVVGIGAVSERVPANQEHEFRIAAAGFADSTFVLTLAASDSFTMHVPLRHLLGDLHVATTPSGATVHLNGDPQPDVSPFVVRGLRTGIEYRVAASLPGYRRVEQEIQLKPDTLNSVSIALAREVTDVVFVTRPSGAEIFLDGVRKGRSTFTLRDIAVGQHSVRAALEGYVSVDTTLNIATDLGTLELPLEREPPGYLTIQGDYPAAIYINENLVVRNVQFSGARELRAGSHDVRVILPNGESVEHTVDLRPGERVVYDYTKNQIVSRSGGGG